MSEVAARTNESGHYRSAPHAGERGHVIGRSTAAGKLRSRPIIMLIASGTALVAAIIVGIAVTTLNLRDSALADSERELGNTALLIAKYAEHEIEELDLVQTHLLEHIRSLNSVSRTDFERKISGEDVHQLLKNKISGLSHIGSLGVINSDGVLINNSFEWPIRAVNLAARNYFIALKSDANLTSFVSEPLHSLRTGGWVLAFARKVTASNGEFLGTVVGTIDLNFFEKFFRSVVLSGGSSISLNRNDGTILARYPHLDSIIGRVFKGSIGALGDRDRATIRFIGQMEGKDRLLAAQRLEHFPLHVSVAVDVAAALAKWRKEAILLIGLGSFATFLIAIMVFVIARQLLQGKRQFQQELDEQRLRLNTAFSNMSQGLVMFDSTARLLICNDRYRQIYDLPMNLTKRGRTIADLLKYRATNKTFSGDPERYIGDLMAAIVQGKIAKTETTTSDGRIISVVNQPMAGGGWVATHEDITEARRQEASFRLLFKSNPIPMWVHDRESLRFLAVNDAAIAHYGYGREQFLAMTLADIRPPEQRDKFLQFVRNVGESQNGDHTWQHQKSDKTIVEVAIYSRALNYEGYTASLVAAIDITERKRAEDELHRTQHFLNAVVESTPLPIVVKSAPNAAAKTSEWPVTLINRAAEELFGISRNQMVGKSAREFYSKEQADFVVKHDNEALRADRPILVPENTIKTPGNETHIITARKVAIRDAAGKPEYVLSLLEDVTERKRAEQRIAHMAHYDMLTDLPNRAAFNEQFAATIERAAANNEQFAILSTDLDRFKEVNDLFGHAVGDALLREITPRLQLAAAGAFLARIGGDEFMLIVTGVAQPEGARALAERLFAVFTEEFEVEGRRLQIGLSIGGAVYPTDGTDAKTLMVNADTALYRAKAEARGSLLLFEPEMSARLGERLALQGDLRSAIAHGELLLHFQPQVRMTGETIGFEALARWQSPTRGMVSPTTFIPIAEESGLIIPIGEWVLCEACREATSWPLPLTIAVNVSPIQFHHGDLPGLVHSILLETGLAPARLEIEVTEGVLINDFPRAVSILRRLKSLGVQIALDDFGTGYSSLSYLHSFAFDRIKIDRTFIGDLEHNRHSMAIVRAVIGLGHSLDVPVLAEGVETELQHAFLMQEGCDAMQGYLTGWPLPIAEHDKLTGRQSASQLKYATAS